MGENGANQAIYKFYQVNSSYILDIIMNVQ